MAEETDKTGRDDDRASEPPTDDANARDEDDATDEADEPEAKEPPKKATKRAADVAAPAPEARSAVTVRAVTPPPPAASLGKSVTAFLFVMFLLMGGFWFLGTAESPFGKPGQPKWKVGKTETITLTLDPKDDDNLACASETAIAGKRCEFKSKTEKTAEKLDDSTMLKPYKTTADEPLLAAGVWSAPEIAKGKRPNGRFNYKCQFKVEGKITRPLVRWNVAGQWGEQEGDWFVGSVSNCTVEK
ncbi:MAG: hypothetical protein HOW73_06280 [Polyangiaceae bacterium]|nr:hypothetical protein [Polyangiaceae bacterium]